MGLSFLEAFSAKQSGEISWDEYLHILLTRLTGVRNDQKGTSSKLRYTDPFGHSIWMWSQHMKAINNIKPIEAVFKAYQHGTFADVKTKFALLEAEGLPEMGMKCMKSLLRSLHVKSGEQMY